MSGIVRRQVGVPPLPGGDAGTGSDPARAALRPVVAVFSTGPAAADAAASVPALVFALAAGGRRVAGVALVEGRAVRGSRGRVHDAVVRGLAAALGATPLTLPVSATGYAGRRLAGSLAQGGLDDAALLCFGELAARTGLAARAAAPGLRIVARLDCAPDTPLSDPDAVVCSTGALARRMLKEHRLPFAAVACVPPLALPVANAEALRSSARRHLGLSDDETAYLLTGDLRDDELPDETALLFATLVRRRGDARLVIATRARARATQAVRQAGLRRVIVVAPPTPENRSVFAAADYLLLLRSPAATGAPALRVFGDALVCGARPVLVAGTGDQADVCATAGLGVVLTSSDAGQAVALVRDAEWPGALGPEARAHRRAWAEQHTGPAPIAARLAAVIDALGYTAPGDPIWGAARPS